MNKVPEYSRLQPTFLKYFNSICITGYFKYNEEVKLPTITKKQKQKNPTKKQNVL